MKNLLYKISRKALLTVCILGAGVKMNAQSTEIGFRLMSTFSSIDFQTSDGGVVKGPMTIGLGFDGLIGFSLGDHLGLQAEFIYNSINQTSTVDDTEQKLNLQYINIPLLISLNTGKLNAINFNIVAGPQVGINVGSSFTSTGDPGVVTTTGVVAVKQGDLGVAYGAGIDFGLNKNKSVRLGLGFRGVYGLIDISDNSNSITTDKYYVLDRAHLKTYSGYIGLSFLL